MTTDRRANGRADPLDQFSAATAEWFRRSFAAPTPAQLGAWRAIGRGEHVLVIAPTGSGKTLAAFLSAIDQLATTPRPTDLRRSCRVLYISPLKALAVDIERNLRAPLVGIGHSATRLGLPPPDVRVAIRSGDTPADERRTFARRPPDIAITTPESLFLMLTSSARDALRGVEVVIVDEVHSICGAKRGAHLAVSLERLDALLAKPAQRIGLSATVRPTAEVAHFLAAGRPVTVVDPPAARDLQLRVVVPVPDMTALGEPTGDLTGNAAGPAKRASIWPAVEERVLDEIEKHHSTIVFANSRRLAERLTSRLNELAALRRGDPPPDLGTRMPAEVMGEAGIAVGAPPIVARAHHGSVSREQRVAIEEDLKAGRLPAVVATSSLELGIDMGAVDLVIQVEPPPSVAAGMQRVGRAGHQVGATSHGVFFPKHRGDLMPTAVIAERMRGGQIEATRYPRNPLDVLAQQIVSMVALDDWRVDDLAAVVRRAAPFESLSDKILESVLDMLSGRYPSDEFAELRPRLVWDRATDTLSGRRGAQRLAVTSGGTIPDRGAFGVFLVGEAGEPGRRVGELDEEMVYESRVSDVFLLGTTSWRIEDITHDRVIVSPAPGQPARMPFWHGDSPGRPLELGRALGAALRELGGADHEEARGRLRDDGFDDWAADNLLDYLQGQRQATGHLPDDRTVVVERFLDELGDWRMVIHSPFGAPVNAPWAQLISARLAERYGATVPTMHSDDGIVLRLPETDGDPPSAELVAIDPDEVEQLVTEAVGGSSLFASRFRECAARALLLPRRDPRRRTPLWQQRQRAAQLLQITAGYGSFPIVLETMRECLQDVYDVPGLVEVMRDLQSRRLRLVDAQTATASPFAQSLLFGYIGTFLYDGDAPLAERRAQALTLDTGLLAELLGQAELRDLLDPEAMALVEAELQWLTESRAAFDVDSTEDLLRVVGDLSAEEASARGARPEWLAELQAARRALVVRIAGEGRWIAATDAARVRDALGVALPVGTVEDAGPDPVGDLVGRYARTHGPFHTEECAARLGIGAAVAEHALRRLAAAGRVATGEFRPGGVGHEWCDTGVLRQLRRRSLAKLRGEVEPVPQRALARFLPRWQQVGTATPTGRHGSAAVARAVEQLAGVPLPASALESLILPARVADYEPAMLDQLMIAGEIRWCGAGAAAGNDGWIVLGPADAAELLLPPPEEVADSTQLAVLDALTDDAALFFRTLADRVQQAGTPDDQALATAIWDLVWAGHLTNDTLAPLRSLLSVGGAPRPRPPRLSHRAGHRALGRARMPSRTGPPTLAGRWSRLPKRIADATLRAHASAEAMLDRHGVLTRGAVVAEGVPGGFAAAYRVLRAFEEAGHTRQGYFVAGLGAAQFALPGAVDQLRSADDSRDNGRVAASAGGAAITLSACDPANPYGAVLPWPGADGGEPGGDEASGPSTDEPGADQSSRATGHRPGRKAGALVVMVDGELALYLERGGRSLLTFTDEADLLRPAVRSLADTVTGRQLGRLTVQRVDGQPVASHPLADALEEAGFRATPRGLQIRS
jgi:ATP-dependent Lhr-like helicase